MPTPARCFARGRRSIRTAQKSIPTAGGRRSRRRPPSVCSSVTFTLTEVVGNGTSGSTTVSVTPGFTGTLAATAAGLNLATVDTVTVPKGAAGTTT